MILELKSPELIEELVCLVQEDPVLFEDFSTQLCSQERLLKEEEAVKGLKLALMNVVPMTPQDLVSNYIQCDCFAYPSTGSLAGQNHCPRHQAQSCQEFLKGAYRRDGSGGALWTIQRACFGKTRKTI